MTDVKRYTAVELRFATRTDCDYVSAADYDALCAALADSAERDAAQHRGEPVVLPKRMPEGRKLPKGYAEAWNACLTEVEKLCPLYTHADAGEVEQLAILLRQTQVKHSQERDTLRAQLAERDALLREAITVCRTNDLHITAGHFEDKLSASAETSAPVERDERAEFENTSEPDGANLDRNSYDDYVNPYVQSSWEGWQARAALERKLTND